MGYFALRDLMSPYATVLTFHRVNDKKQQDGLTVHPRLFDELLDVLVRRYRIVSLVRLCEMVSKSETLPARTVALTFDDGYLDNFSVVAPILKDRKLPATFFVTSGYVETTRRFPWDVSDSVSHPMMTWEHVRQLAAEGFEVGAHSVNHLNLGVCTADIARKEITDSKRHIEDQLGMAIAGFAYPFGWKWSMNEVTSRLVREAGFAYSCSNYGGKVTDRSDIFNIQRTGVYPTTTEMLMEVDSFMTHYDGVMRMHVLGACIPIGSSGDQVEDKT
ncbi:MAG TPA: polysaccharide deacetylase family protein [Nitrospira sp.]|nr:polysaccharide deacetylase family protein [Nitrospira sp.]